MNNTASSSLTGSGSSVGGTVYLKSGHLTLTGSGQTLNSRVVVDRLTLTGSGSINVNAQANTNAPVPGGAALSE
jgi:hypothetical protein